MIWGVFLFWRIIWAMVGAFGTACIHEKQGRDVTMGGLMGLVVGGVGGIFFLMLFWVWLYYSRGGFAPVGRASNLRKRWYNWWG